MKQKRLVTIQDISCLGKCSLGAAIPIISAFGIESVVLPTAMLSTHTGAGFEDYTFRDLTDDMTGVIDHWKKLGLSFDAMYSGYLGSIHQLEITERFFRDFKTKDNLVFVDPVMADEGVLYKGFDDSFAKRMISLCAYADVICPNVTEACLITDTPYTEKHDNAFVEELADKLCGIGAKTIIVTGINIEDQIGAMCIDAESGKRELYVRPKFDGHYYGTGDIFASVVCSALTHGFDMNKALHLATDFVYESILATQDEKDKFYYGVKFEKCLNKITKVI